MLLGLDGVIIVFSVLLGHPGLPKDLLCWSDTVPEAPRFELSPWTWVVFFGFDWLDFCFDESALVSFSRGVDLTPAINNANFKVN